MLFTSPAFLFLFLPLSLIFYLLFGKKRRRLCLLIICVIYHFLQNLMHPLNMLFLPGLIVYTYFIGKLLTRKKSRLLCVLLCLLPCLFLAALRIPAYHGVSGFVYPTGFTVATLSAVSCLITFFRGEERASGDLLSVTAYLAFFPIMIVGPLIRYPDFLRLTSEENIEFDLKNVASGARLFMTGFIKRIAVGAVLFENFHLFITLSENVPNIIFGLFLMVLIYFAVFFIISGYNDMAVGLCRLYGLTLYEKSFGPFHAYTPDSYSFQLFGSLKPWIDDYLVKPLTASGRHSRNYELLLGSCLQATLILLLVRSTPRSLLLLLPLFVLNYLFRRFSLEDKLRQSSGLRFVFSLIAIPLFALIWMYLILDNPSEIFAYIGGITHDNTEYRTNLVLSTFSGLKYLFVLLVAALTVWWRQTEGQMMVIRSPQKKDAVLFSVSTGFLLLFFLFTVVFFLPQYSVYDTRPFLYLFE